MDNASKALIMAGAVFITILLISLTVYTLSQIRSFSEATSTQTLATQTEAFNRFFVYSETYGNAPIKGYDVYNIICKAIDINKGWSAEKIEIKYLGSDYTNKNASEVKAMFTQNDKALMKESFYYEYTLSQITGKVEKVTFTK